PNFSLHSLRHSHASIPLGNGMPLAIASERLGHANQDITLSLHSHSLPAYRKAASRVSHTALAEVISEDRLRKSEQILAQPRREQGPRREHEPPTKKRQSSIPAPGFDSGAS